MDNDDYDAQEWIHSSPYGHLHLRDFFAAFALAGLSYEHLTPSDAARTAYERADAMLAQRNERLK